MDRRLNGGGSFNAPRVVWGLALCFLCLLLCLPPSLPIVRASPPLAQATVWCRTFSEYEKRAVTLGMTALMHLSFGEVVFYAREPYQQLEPGAN